MSNPTTNSASQNRKKRSLLINPKFQWTLIGYVSIVALLVLAVSFGLFTFGFNEFSSIGLQAGLPSDHVYFEFLRMQESTFLRVFVALAILIAAILVVGGLIVSHKIAGPIYRMQKEFNKMQEEDPVRLREIYFRKGDFFPELAETYNELVRKIK